MTDPQNKTDEFNVPQNVNRAANDVELSVTPPQTGKVLTYAGIFMLGAAIIGGMIAVSPKIDEKLARETAQAERIAELEKEIARAKSGAMNTAEVNNGADAGSDAAASSALNALSPTKDAEDTAQAIKDKINQVTTEVANLRDQAVQMKQAVTDLQSGSMPERIAKLETNMTQFLNVEQQAQLFGMFDRVRMMSESVTGGQSIQKATTAILGSMANATDPTKAINDVRAVNADVAKTLDGVAPEDAQAAVMLLAFTQMRTSLMRDNESFENDLALLKQTVAKNDPALQASIDRLSPHAKLGVLTPDGLSKELQSLTGELVQASLSDQNTSLQDRALARLGNIIKIEKNGVPITGNETQKILSTAQTFLNKGDVEAAVKVLQSLTGAPAQKVAPFIQQATATIEAQQVQTQVGKTIIENLQTNATQLAQGGSVNTTAIQQIIAGVSEMLPSQIGYKPLHP